MKDTQEFQETQAPDAERHKRFIETAKKVDASETIKDFDKAFADVVRPARSGAQHSSKTTER
jgi:hypothetical protein